LPEKNKRGKLEAKAWEEKTKACGGRERGIFLGWSRHSGMLIENEVVR
jgi:hypothetical protein